MFPKNASGKNHVFLKHHKITFQNKLMCNKLKNYVQKSKTGKSL